MDVPDETVHFSDNDLRTIAHGMETAAAKYGEIVAALAVENFGAVGEDRAIALREHNARLGAHFDIQARKAREIAARIARAIG